MGGALLGSVELPCPVDGPVAEEAVAGEAKGSRGFGVLEEVADQSWANSRLVSDLAAMSFKMGARKLKTKLRTSRQTY